METLTLTIESPAKEDLHTQASIDSTGKSITIGRRASNDWTLPDETRHISGHHFDIRYEDAAYYLHDLSTNGTFVNSAKDRIEGRHLVTDGDRIHAGIYVIHARLQPAAHPVSQPGPPVNIPAAGARNMPNAASSAASSASSSAEPGRNRVQAPPGAAFLMGAQKSSVQAPHGGGAQTKHAAQTPDFSRFQDGGGSQAKVSSPPQHSPPTPAQEIPVVVDAFDDILDAAFAEPAPIDAPDPDPAPDADPDFNSDAAAPAPPALLAPETPSDKSPQGVALAPSDTPLPTPPDLQIPDDDFTRDLPRPQLEPSPQPDPPRNAAPGTAEFTSELSHAPRGLGETFGSTETPAPFLDDDWAPAQVDPASAPRENPPSPSAQNVPPPSVDPATAPSPDLPAQPDPFLEGFLEGAGIEDAETLQIPLKELGKIVGRCARMGTHEMMQMLQDRSAVKLFVAQDDRTMRVSSGNNPLKFMTDRNDAFDTLFVAPRDGYQTGADGFENALTDIRKHQAAIMAAIQPAMADMFNGLAPSDIETATGRSSGGVLGGGAKKCWEEYNKRWNARAEIGENGMLDTFIDAFAKRYSEALDQL